MITFSPSLTLVTLAMKFQPRLEFLVLLYLGFASDTTPTFRKHLEGILPSFLTKMSDMQFDLLVLAKLKMLLRWPKLFKMLSTNLSLHKLSGIV